MTVSITSSYINQFSDNLHNLLEDKGAKTRGVFPVEMANGEKHFFDRLGSFVATEVTSRLQNTPLQDPNHSRRMASLKRYVAATYLDDIDKFKMLIDPTSDYARKLSTAHGRNYDAAVFTAALGSAATGVDGTGSQAFDSNQQIAHGSAGLTVAKFNQALRMLQANEVDIEDDLVLFVNSRGIEDLLGDTTNQMTSFDFMGSKPLADGKVPMFRGVQIVHTERIPDQTASSVYRALLCTKDAVKVAMAHDVKVEVDKRPDILNAYQVLTTMMFGAVRMEEGMIVDILFQ